jgi:hypothetical protein
MTDRPVERRTVLSGGLALGAGLVANAAQAQVPAQTQAPAAAAAAASGNAQLLATKKSIGFLHSTQLDSGLEAAFLQGLRKSGKWEGDPRTTPVGNAQRVKIRKRFHFGNYGGNDSNDLENLGKELQRRGTDIIVATGGLVSAKAVRSYTKPILVIIGSGDQNIITPNMAGWNMDCFTANRTRVQKLTNIYGVSPSNICLFYNSNSSMGVDEKDDWKMNVFPPAVNPLAVNMNNNDHNEDVDFSGAFDSALMLFANGPNPRAPKAIVVSADPFLTKQRQDIIDEAKKRNIDTNLKLVMCYPNDYLLPSDLDLNLNMAYGPVMTEIFSDLGEKAASLLTGDAISPLAPISETTMVKNTYKGKMG